MSNEAPQHWQPRNRDLKKELWPAQTQLVDHMRATFPQLFYVSLNKKQRRRALMILEQDAPEAAMLQHQQGLKRKLEYLLSTADHTNLWMDHSKNYDSLSKKKHGVHVHLSFNRNAALKVRNETIMSGGQGISITVHPRISARLLNTMDNGFNDRNVLADYIARECIDTMEDEIEEQLETEGWDADEDDEDLWELRDEDECTINGESITVRRQRILSMIRDFHENIRNGTLPT